MSAVQYVVVGMSISPNSRNRIKTDIVYNSGLLFTQSDIADGKRKAESVYKNVVRVSDSIYEMVKDEVAYTVHRYEYVSVLPYSY